MKIFRYAGVGATAATVDFLIFAVFAKLLNFNNVVSKKWCQFFNNPLMIVDGKRHDFQFLALVFWIDAVHYFVSTVTNYFLSKSKPTQDL